MGVGETVREFISAFNAGDRIQCRALVGDDCVYREHGTARQVRGGRETVAACLTWHVAWPDLTGSIERLLVAGEHVVWETVWRGHHIGAVSMSDLGVDGPSGVFSEVPACLVFTVNGGRITEIDHYFDPLGFVSAIGATPAPAAV
jgi:steroid delta-isomerase-like uncharacterized protein